MWRSADGATVPKLLRDATERWPDSTFIDFSGDKYTYRETDREVMRLAHGFRALGVEKGDRVASLLDNVADTVFVWFAVNTLGAIYVPINTDYKGEYLRHQLADSGAKLIVTEPHYADRVIALENELPSLERLIVRGDLPDDESRIRTTTLDSLRSDRLDPITEDVGLTDLTTLIYTSGTTGPSKGCMVGHSYAYNFGYQNTWHGRVEPGDVVWTPAPMFHTAAAFGVVVNCLIAGATASIYSRFSVTNFWPEIERSGATHVCMLSIMLTLIPNAGVTDASRRCFGQIKVLFGSPLPTALKAEWKEKFGVQRASSPGYGMTEASMTVLMSSYDPDVPGDACGRRHDDFDVRIIGDDGNECPPNVPGEITFRPRRAGVMFQGYWNQPAATAAAIRDCWFHTGDIGKFDEEDFFYFVDRKKDYLRRGGENISSYEVEAAFRNHPAVAEVAAHSAPSELAEDELKVTVILHPGTTISEEELCQWSVDRLPHFAVPRYIEFREQFPTTPTGKVQKNVLRSEGVTPSTWDRKTSGIVVGRHGARSSRAMA